MSGVKGRSGGARVGSGRLQTRLLLSKEAARELTIIVKQRRSINPSICAEDIISQWIHEYWQEIDAYYQDKSEQKEEE